MGSLIKMATLQRTTASFHKFFRNTTFTRMMSSDHRSGQSEGAIREAGGSFGKKEKAEEDQFFRRQQQEQLKKLKEAEASRKTEKQKQVGKKVSLAICDFIYLLTTAVSH